MKSSRCCDKCGADSTVIDSRHHEYGMRRRRYCENCDIKWSTIETRIDVLENTEEVKKAARIKLQEILKRILEEMP